MGEKRESPRLDDLYDSVPQTEAWTVVDISQAVRLRGWSCSDGKALDFLKELEDRGYVERVGDWRGDPLWQRSAVVPDRRRGRYVLDAPTKEERDEAERLARRAEIVARCTTQWVWCLAAQQAMAKEVHDKRGCTCGAVVRTPSRAA